MNPTYSPVKPTYLPAKLTYWRVNLSLKIRFAILNIQKTEAFLEAGMALSVPRQRYLSWCLTNEVFSLINSNTVNFLDERIVSRYHTIQY